MTVRVSSLARAGTSPERAEMWRLPDLPDLDLLKAHYVTQDFAPHTHDEFAIGVIEAGTQVFTCRGRTWTAPAGSVVAINPGEVHTGHAADERGWTYRMLYPHTRWITDAAGQIGGRDDALPEFRTSVIHDRELTVRIGRLHRALEDGGCALRGDSLLCETMAYMVSAHARPATRTMGPAAAHPAVAKAREMLHAGYASRIRLAELAAAVGLSQFHLLRIFRRETGLPPHRYLELVRINRARRLLLDGTPPSATAYQTGFSDQSHLSRAFKRVVGVPPARFQRAWKS